MDFDVMPYVKWPHQIGFDNPEMNMLMWLLWEYMLVVVIGIWLLAGDVWFATNQYGAT